MKIRRKRRRKERRSGVRAGGGGGGGGGGGKDRVSDSSGMTVSQGRDNASDRQTDKPSCMALKLTSTEGGAASATGQSFGRRRRRRRRRGRADGSVAEGGSGAGFPGTTRVFYSLCVGRLCLTEATPRREES